VDDLVVVVDELREAEHVHPREEAAGRLAADGRLAAGRQIKGYKVGLTSEAMQQMAGSTEPDFSAMTDDMFIPEDTPIDMSRSRSPS